MKTLPLRAVCEKLDHDWQVIARGNRNSQRILRCVRCGLRKEETD